MEASSLRRGVMSSDWPSGEPMKEERLMQSSQRSFALI